MVSALDVPIVSAIWEFVKDMSDRAELAKGLGWRMDGEMTIEVGTGIRTWNQGTFCWRLCVFRFWSLGDWGSEN